ncbi:MAG: hypothetical protein Q8K93_18695 [Reyranella sp.]|uniref:hypothetical protein n=1 Tax=Reyranella sp. TaxID=1929291 RepID=UPI00272F9B24|nr:hypothetical protein [Reyranella sp.]MDP1964218.1 hypothetical protein [Reyranella sp.]MDP2372347.1 hypothetical protein [Reyranella sp.]
MADTSAQADEKVPWAARLDELLVPVLRHRIERSGIQDSGAYNFYDMRLKGSSFFSDYELALARKFLSSSLGVREIHEIGSGFGQLMFLLGWNGFKTVGFEADRARAQTARDLKAIMDVVDPTLTANVQLLEAEFPSPEAPMPAAHSLILTTNLVATRTLPQQLAILKEMRKYPFVLTDVQRFFKVRLEPAEQQATFALFAEAGFEEPEVFLDLGAGGRYYLFRNSDVEAPPTPSSRESLGVSDRRISKLVLQEGEVLPKIEFRGRSKVRPESNYLLKYARNVTSQVGQDGIFEKMLEIIGIENKWCVEFGGMDGKRLSNTWNLIHNHKWSGVLMEGNTARFKELEANHAEHDVAAFNEYVGFSGENRLDEILRRTKIPTSFDVLSIDIDGNDWHVWEALTDYRPRIVCIEFNPTISNDVFFVQDADPTVNQGCSLLALIDLAKAKDYELVATTSWDAILVPKELFPKFNISDNSIDSMYSPHTRETRLFQGYDGTFYAAGNLMVQWKQIPFQQDELQILPRAMRKY